VKDCRQKVDITVAKAEIGSIDFRLQREQETDLEKYPKLP
jgi:hypothetical protein